MKHPDDDDPRDDGPPEEIPQILLPTEEEAQALLERQVGEEELLPAIPKADLPGVLVVFPLRRSVPFPGLVMPVQAEAGNETGIMEQALAQGRHVGLLLAEGGDAATLPRPREFRRVGVVAEVHKRIRLPDGNSSYLCKGVCRFTVKRFLRRKNGAPVARVSYPEDIYPKDEKGEAMARNVLMLSQKVANHNPALGEGFTLAAHNMDPVGHLADFATAYLVKEVEAKQQVLETLDVAERLHKVDVALTRELVTLELGDRIQQEIRSKVEDQQKEFFLREQIKIIRRELGEEKDPQERDRDHFLAKLADHDYPEEVDAKVREEVERLAMVPPVSPEYPVIRNYLEWLVELPWNRSSEDRLDLDEAERILDRDHYGLVEPKERILEFLAVRRMRPGKAGAILCFTGPPGVGKTSLAMAMSEGMNRKLERISLGGMRDEAEIKGHRRTYVGAMPGRILQMMRRAGTDNPVIVLDEVDKLGKDFRGDPSSALLEVLDPAQNSAFLDLYMDLPFDLSKVMFVATANVPANIPPPLRDRMELIELPGYVNAEKIQIGRRHLVPRQLEAHGLDTKRLKIPVATLRALVGGWTREAGVRGLEKAIASLCRKRALEVARKKRRVAEVKPGGLEKYLGPPKWEDDPVRLTPGVGVALGLAYTPAGGDVLEAECVAVSGKGKVSWTGSLGDVMTESCRIAHSLLRSSAETFGISEAALASQDLHVHFPAGAVRKDGPSAGITIAAAMLGRLTGRQMRPRTAMSGEITLTGEILPVGGLREKVLAAKRQGVKRVVLPAQNRPDVEILDPAWTRGLQFHWVKTFEEALPLLFHGFSGK